MSHSETKLENLRAYCWQLEESEALAQKSLAEVQAAHEAF